MHACIQHTYMCACIHTYVHTYIHTQDYGSSSTYNIHACLHAYIHMYIHTYILRMMVAALADRDEPVYAPVRV